MVKHVLAVVCAVLCLAVLLSACSQGYLLKFPETELLRESSFDLCIGRKNAVSVYQKRENA